MSDNLTAIFGKLIELNPPPVRPPLPQSLYIIAGIMVVAGIALVVWGALSKWRNYVAARRLKSHK